MYEKQTIAEIEKELQTSSVHGLSKAEAKKRLEEHGSNALAQGKKKGWLLVFLGEFNDSLIYLLLGAAVISMILGE